MRGKFKTITAVRGFGFITGDADGRDYFVRAKDLCNRTIDTVAIGEAVEFDTQSHPRGLRAVNVRVI